MIFVVVKWKIPTEDYATAAEALFVDWEQQVVDVAVPNHFPSEVISAFLRAARRDRITADEARKAMQEYARLTFCTLRCDGDCRPGFRSGFSSTSNGRMTASMWRSPNERGSSYELVMSASTMLCTPQEPDSRAALCRMYPGVKASLYGQFLSFI